MILKDSQLHKEWPTVLTPEQREEFLKEKLARAQAWYSFMKKHDTQKQPNLDRS
jgi:hypothetical protein